MRKIRIKVFGRMLAIGILGMLIFGCNQKKFDHYGVFVEGTNGVKEAKGFSWSGLDDNYDGSSNFNPEPVQTSDTVTIYAYAPTAKTADYRLLADPTRRSS